AGLPASERDVMKMLVEYMANRLDGEAVRLRSEARLLRTDSDQLQAEILKLRMHATADAERIAQLNSDVQQALKHPVSEALAAAPQPDVRHSGKTEKKHTDCIRDMFAAAMESGDEPDVEGTLQLILGYLETTTNAPMLLAHITYNVDLDDDRSDDPDTYDDNQLTVDAVTSNFPEQPAIGSYLPQVADSVYYRAVNSGVATAEDTEAGKLTVHPVMVPLDAGLVTHGSCYGLIACVGDSSTLPENMAEIISALGNELRNMLVKLASRLDKTLAVMVDTAKQSNEQRTTIAKSKRTWSAGKVDFIARLKVRQGEQQVAAIRAAAASRKPDRRQQMLELLNSVPEWRACCSNITEGIQGKKKAEAVFLRHGHLKGALSEMRKWRKMARVALAAVVTTLLILGDEMLLRLDGFNGGNLTVHENGLQGLWIQCQSLLKKRVVVSQKGARRTCGLLERMRDYDPMKAGHRSSEILSAIEELNQITIEAVTVARSSSCAHAITVSLAQWTSSIYNVAMANQLKTLIEEECKSNYPTVFQGLSSKHLGVLVHMQSPMGLEVVETAIDDD
ncbi:hypothetical protein CYMTET_45422, partial [Cymbomonas tetramitiformis]